MEIIIKNSKEEVDAYAAALVAAYVRDKPKQLLVFPTGNTPLGMYKKLAACVAKKDLSFDECHLIELDEYMGIADNDPRNLFQWLKKALLNHIDIPDKNCRRFHAAADDIEAQCRKMDEIIQSHGGIDLLILGLGPNGHLGFNEPGSPFNAPTRIIDLTPASLQSSANYWGNITQVPKQGLTLGMQALSQAKKTILLVKGENKAGILKETLQGEITPEIPATLLRTMENVTVIMDREAGREI
jgi:glucosamine-6-phosphate deaminase